MLKRKVALEAKRAAAGLSSSKKNHNNHNDNNNDNDMDLESGIHSDNVSDDSDDDYSVFNNNNNNSSSSSSSSSPSASSSSSVPAAVLSSSIPDLSRYINKQRVLIFSSRGISKRDRHFLDDLRDLLPHSKKETKIDTKKKLGDIINELSELKACNKCIFLENRKRQDLYLWLSSTPHGPSIKFLLQNIHTMAEVKMTGNCMKGSRPLLLFDGGFDSTPSYQLMKELLTQVFGTPKAHPKSKPFFDHIFSFFIADNRIWFRNYQILYNPPDKPAGTGPMLVEIGPRFVLNPIRIFAGSFGGSVLWENNEFISPNALRRMMKAEKGDEYAKKMAQRKLTKDHREYAKEMPAMIVDDVFENKIHEEEDDDDNDDEEEEQGEEEENEEEEEQQDDEDDE